MVNILQAVQTYQASALGWLQNLYCFINTCNNRFRNFNDMIANLGDTVTYDLPPRMAAQPGLVVPSFLGVQQRVRSLVCGATDAFGNQQSANVPFAFTAQELIFNIDNNDYREKFEISAMTELGAQIEASVASTILTGPYRFYGDGTTAINSFGQLAQMMAFFRNFGSVNYLTRGYLSDLAVPSIVNSGLNQFALNRNNEIANSWEVGRFDNTDWYRSNFLPVHISGTTGTGAQTLTVVSIDSTGTQLTVSGANNSDSGAVLANDLFQFQDGVGSYPNLRYLTFIGHKPSGNPVQFRATVNAGSTSGGNVTLTIDPPLISQAGNINQNLNYPIQSGMQIKGLPSHRRGLVCSGDAMFLAMPQLPDQTPFPTANKADEMSGAAIRFTQGATFGQNQNGFIFDAIWGSDFVPEYCMGIIFPLSQG